MKNYINEFGQLVALDGEYEIFFFATERILKQLQSSYSRKNSKYNSQIVFKAEMIGDNSIYWKFYLQCFVNGKLVQNYRIREEVYLGYTNNKETKQVLTGVYQFIYHEHIGSKPAKKAIVKKTAKLPVVNKSSNLLIDILSKNDEIENLDHINENKGCGNISEKSSLLIDILYQSGETDTNKNGFLFNIL